MLTLSMLQNSTERPAWSSENNTGNLAAFNHRHKRPRDGSDCVIRNFYRNTKGFHCKAALRELEG